MLPSKYNGQKDNIWYNVWDVLRDDSEDDSKGSPKRDGLDKSKDNHGRISDDDSNSSSDDDSDSSSDDDAFGASLRSKDEYQIRFTDNFEYDYRDRTKDPIKIDPVESFAEEYEKGLMNSLIENLVGDPVEDPLVTPDTRVGVYIMSYVFTIDCYTKRGLQKEKPIRNICTGEYKEIVYDDNDLRNVATHCSELPTKIEESESQYDDFYITPYIHQHEVDEIISQPSWLPIGEQKVAGSRQVNIWEDVVTTNKKIIELRCESRSKFQYTDLKYDSFNLSRINKIDRLYHQWGSDGGSIDGSDDGNDQLYVLPTFLTLPSEEQKVASNISFIPESIKSLKYLEKLHFNNIPLNTLPESISELKYLTVINITGCYLVSFPESVYHVVNLKELSVTSCNLISLPESISTLQNLQKLYLYGNQFTSLPESIGSLYSLEYLSISNNPLTSLPYSFGNLSSIIDISVNDTHIGSLPDSICNLTTLRYLYCMNCQLESLPESIGDLVNLLGLYINHNKLTSLPRSISKLRYLERVVLDNNHFRSIPEALFDVKLCQLDLSYCNLDMFDIPLCIEYHPLFNLSTLNLSHTNLSVLPDSIGILINLSELKCLYNNLTTLPESIGNLTKLTKLNCSHNNLVSLPESIGNLTILTEFDCSHNNLISLPDSVGNFKILYCFNCSYNKIKMLPDLVGNLTKVHFFDCCHNHLCNLPWTIYKLKSLWGFMCTDNQLTCLPIQLYCCDRLTCIKYSGNPIEFISGLLIKKLYELSLDKYNSYSSNSHYDNVVPLRESVAMSLMNLLNKIPIQRKRIPFPYTYTQRSSEECYEDFFRPNYQSCDDWSDLRIYQEASDDDMFKIMNGCPYITTDVRKFILQCIKQTEWYPRYQITFKDALMRVIYWIESSGDLRKVLYTRLCEMMIIVSSRYDGFKTFPNRLYMNVSERIVYFHRVNELFTRLIDTLVPYFEDMRID